MPALNDILTTSPYLPNTNTQAVIKSAQSAIDVAITKASDTPTIFPIYDIPIDTKYSPEEVECRKKLATVYRLVDYFKWTQIIYNHITMKVPGTEDILINPFGLQYYEISASNLVKMTLDGKILDRGPTKYGVNEAGYIIHTAIHEVRPDINCTLHLHNTAIAAVSSMKCGLLQINQEAMIIGPVAYLDYGGIFETEKDKKELRESIKDPRVKILFLRNHGFVALGETAEEAWLLTYYTVLACETQVKTMVGGLDNVIIPSEKSIKKARDVAARGANNYDNHQWKRYKYGELEWEAWMRELDILGYKTGHVYQNSH